MARTTRTTRSRAGRPFDRGAAYAWLHERLHDGRITEALFWLGDLHVALTDETGRHCTSKSELARLYSEARQPVQDTQVGRMNGKLVALGFLQVAPRQRETNRAYLPNEFQVVTTCCDHPQDAGSTIWRRFLGIGRGPV